MKEITMNKSYFYLDMKTHELEVPFTRRNRRVRVLLPKGYAEDTERTILLFISMMDKMFSIAKNHFQVILGKLFQRSSAIQILVK